MCENSGGPVKPIHVSVKVMDWLFELIFAANVPCPVVSFGVTSSKPVSLAFKATTSSLSARAVYDKVAANATTTTKASRNFTFEHLFIVSSPLEFDCGFPIGED